MKDIQHYYDLLLEELNKWLEAIVAGLPDAVLALLVILIFYIFSLIMGKMVHRLFDRFSDAKALNRLMSTAAKVAIFIIGIIIALGILGLQKLVFSLLAGAGVIGLAIGFAFQDLAANFIAGIFMAFRRPFNHGDVIKTDGLLGTVQELNMRNTLIKTFDGQLVVIPNKTVFENPLTNYTSLGSRRIHLEVGVSYDTDLSKATYLIKKTIEDFDFLAANTSVDVIAKQFGGSSINFDIYYWIVYPQGKKGYLEAIHDGILAIKSTLDKESIEIPFPIRTLNFPDEAISINQSK